MLSLGEMREPSVIDCPGEIITYYCSIVSNTENLLLTWNIDFPGNTSLTITYDGSFSNGTVNDLGWNVSTTLTNYSEDYVESKLEITLLRDFDIRGTKVECSIEDLDIEIVTVDVFLAGTSYSYVELLG